MRKYSILFSAVLMAGCASTPKPSLCDATQQFFETVDPGETKYIELLRSGPYPEDYYRACDSSRAGESGRVYCAFLLKHAPVDQPDNALNALFSCLQGVENNWLHTENAILKWQGEASFKNAPIAPKGHRIHLRYHMDETAIGEEDNIFVLSVTNPQ